MRRRRPRASPDASAHGLGTLRDELNRHLNGINAMAGAANLYVLDRAGVGLAASDWAEPGTPIGADLSFRPYMTQALAHGRGRFYGVGITSKRAGYYLSYALRHQGLQRGVVILSSREDWKFRPLSALAPSVLADIASMRPYGAATLAPLDLRVSKGQLGDATLVELDGGSYLNSARPLRSTVALLGEEVEARKGIEADLRATQSDLVHAGKMAALGQMSAGVVHELNQPLGALRTLSDNACVLLEHDRLDDVRANLLRIAHLVDRLGRLTYQLKAFAHKTPPVREPVALRQVIANAQFLVSQRLRDNGVELEVRVQPPELAALAEEARLEQVLVNLLGNAIDAMAAAPLRRLRVTASADTGPARCLIRVSDTGPGIRADILPRLFEPFITSKPADTGLGLGLMLSAHIVREFGGSLRAFNLDGAGACFEIELPLASQPEMEVNE